MIWILDDTFRERHVSPWNVPLRTRYDGDMRSEADIRQALSAQGWPLTVYDTAWLGKRPDISGWRPKCGFL